MFSFLDDWDPILVDFKKDIDGVIKGEIRLWAVAMQTYCERLMKLFNKKEKIYFDDEKITFGICVNDSYFKQVFQEKTGFYDFNSLRRLNTYGNKRKHYESPNEVEKEEIKEWLKRLHTLSLKTFNYLNNQNYYEEFNEEKVEKLLLSPEDEFFDVVEYADNIISRKNEVILKLENENLELASLISDDTEEIISYKEKIKRLEKTNGQQSYLLKDYKSILDMFEEYLDVNRIKNSCSDEILELIESYGFNSQGRLETLDKEYRLLSKNIRRQHRDIELFIEANLREDTEVQNKIYGNIEDIFDLPNNIYQRRQEELYDNYNEDDKDDGYEDDHQDNYENRFEEYYGAE
ncbi:hypothetical protein [Fusibacter tunisiensis]|uniref:DUF4145 domain-containing protein n=1 Tax=Fusibacter tunisiensis TaxID=1008308 RepID=A0ABS2MTX9_9FIRM|nr:hypothetical protein [Fusibacter tunisiensis]MBM7562868.1 hypothetical protein [Fusibacter tunisiensis]